MSQNRSSAVILLTDAIALGQKWYFTGEPCPRGHIAKRSVSNRDCRGCVNARLRSRRAANPSLVRAKEKMRRDRDPAAYSEQQRSCRLRHIEKRRAYDRQRYHDRPEYRARVKRRALRWSRENQGRRREIIAKRRAWVKRATPSWLTEDHWTQIRQIYAEAARLGQSVDHIYPLRAKNSCGLHVPWNLQIMPLLDNIRKGNRVDGAE